ncbi:MAG TPA: glycosyltransferase, partial [Bacteroidetes bacterium]|nr:glycosyltransferase [Bacteroidota bacterium]
NLDEEVSIINEEVKNMHTLYADSHIVVLINKNHSDTPHYPQSLLEALSVGRPVVTSKINEISDIILKENAGSICDLNEDSVYSAIVDCYTNYSEKQTNARYVAEKYFDIGSKTKQLEEMLL